MDYNLEVKDISTPDGLLRLKTAIRELADECDTLYTETAPNGNISARQGRIAIYNNSGTYSIWVNQDGLLTWSEMTNQSLWEVDGTKTQLKTADEIDMQSKKIISVLDPTSAQDASTKNYVDGKFNTSTGHDHDGSDSKKVIATNLDMTGITASHVLYNNAGTLAGKSVSIGSSLFIARCDAGTVLTSAGTSNVSYGTELYDVASNYTPATDTFTAPVAGYYLFTICSKIVMSTDSNSSGISLQIECSTAGTKFIDGIASMSSSQTEYLGGSILVYLALNETVIPQVTITSLTGSTHSLIIGSNTTDETFTGILLS